ncbi:hypothetical protein [Deinococcus arenicola]|uniref:Uncharacterized protein n=1 Tax=Deinococcus arenicola TaxID=2994950 RepID=A0ABU4DM86_9DEIO|nr:hypothetical protein [Deinococcus sp. ZS9-10]MDV6373057.1 hypothetical protein [Deinococcus sp. ZS9-10]
MTVGLYQLPVKMLEDLISPRALERILNDAAALRGTTRGHLDAQTLEDILKREVFKRLQLSVPAPLAKRRVAAVLAELSRTTQEHLVVSDAALDDLEDHARRFALYFDWPETQRLRGVLGVARQEKEEGRETAALIQEGRDLVAQMDRRLQEGLVVQAQELADLRSTSMHFQSLGSREVRRLDTLIVQVDEAQQQGTLLPGEVDRARTLTYTLRKRLESSLLDTPAGQGPGSLDPAADAQVQARVQELERQHALQLLEGAEREFGPLLLVRPDLGEQLAALRGQDGESALTTDAVEGWRATLGSALSDVLTGQRTRLAELETALADHTVSADARVSLDAAYRLLSGSTLATDELHALDTVLEVLRAGSVDAADSQTAGLSAGRELLDIERKARDLPSAAAELAPLLVGAQAALSGGQPVDLDPLWNVLERHMGAVAQERENFDHRADRIVAEYDAVRDLAGETTQRLGHLADVLRAQRHLGPMSAAARVRYAQTLGDAENLLEEAQAEYRAAQEVTAGFGEDALSGLLDLFELGKDDGLPVADAPTDPYVSEVWQVQGEALLDGPQNGNTVALGRLLTLAGDMGVTDLTLSSAEYHWEAQQDGGGPWRVKRTPRQREHHASKNTVPARPPR